MFEVRILRDHAKVKLVQFGFAWADLLSQGKCELSPGVYITLRKGNTYLLDLTSKDGSGVYDLAPASVQATMPCRVEAAQRGENFHGEHTIQAARAAEDARQTQFREQLLAM